MQRLSRFQTDRLTLDPIRLRDVAFLWRLLGDRNVRRYLGGPVPRAARPRRIAAILRHRQGMWAARRAGQAIGLVELSAHKDGKDTEISYQFCPKAWGHGYASEAIAAGLSHAFQDLGLRRVIAETQAANAASCRLLNRCGFAEETRLMRFGAEQIIFAAYAHSAGSSRNSCDSWA